MRHNQMSHSENMSGDRVTSCASASALSAATVSGSMRSGSAALALPCLCRKSAGSSTCVFAPVSLPFQ